MSDFFLNFVAKYNIPISNTFKIFIPILPNVFIYKQFEKYIYIYFLVLVAG